MKCSEAWLREWVDPTLSREEISERLTMSGLEVEELVLDPASELGPGEEADYVFDVAITPNRGDCLSIRGLAREIAALTGSSLKIHTVPAVVPSSNAVQAVSVEANKACPRYLGRTIRNINTEITTPTYMQKRLRHSGIRSINPVVDVTNYVMLELGQPMHAFDLDKIEQKIIVRQAKQGENIALLDGTEKQLDAETLVIADNHGPLAIAGVMGGMDPGVSLLTKNIFLESAFFAPKVVARQRQQYGLASESAYRFERGVDPTIQREAIERATQLILDIVGGEAGPIVEEKEETALPQIPLISLSEDQIRRVLGLEIPKTEVVSMLSSLGLSIQPNQPPKGANASENTASASHWQVRVPPYRFDLCLSEDLIEEIARLYGYDKIPVHGIKAELQIAHAKKGEAKDFHGLRQLICDLGYHEIISYSFVDKNLQQLLDDGAVAAELVNPISNDMTVMRTNLWPGLIKALVYNSSRQQQRVRLFEIGICFNKGVGEANKWSQRPQLGGLATGTVFPEQWGHPSREVDFFDIKGDIERLLAHFMIEKDIVFTPKTHPALHPGRSASLVHQGNQLGMMGALHPNLLQSLGIEGPVYVYQLDLALLEQHTRPALKEVSKFPEIRRDIAILINEAIPARQIQDTIKLIAGNWLKNVFIFDVYQGKGISPGLKSIAFALVFQHPGRTLVDDEVSALMERIITTLKGKFEAELRR